MRGIFKNERHSVGQPAIKQEENFSVVVNPKNVHDRVVSIPRPSFMREGTDQESGFSMNVRKDTVEFTIPKAALMGAFAGLAAYLFYKGTK